jgi:hypothetical protein
MINCVAPTYSSSLSVSKPRRNRRKSRSLEISQATSAVGTWLVCAGTSRLCDWSSAPHFPLRQSLASKGETLYRSVHFRELRTVGQQAKCISTNDLPVANQTSSKQSGKTTLTAEKAGGRKRNGRRLLRRIEQQGWFRVGNSATLSSRHGASEHLNAINFSMVISDCGRSIRCPLATTLHFPCLHYISHVARHGISTIRVRTDSALGELCHWAVNGDDGAAVSLLMVDFVFGAWITAIHD